MNRDTLRTKTFTVQCYTQYIGVIATTRIAYRGHFIDIYTKFCHKLQGIFIVSAAKVEKIREKCVLLRRK